jgi:hypothetical protein
MQQNWLLHVEQKQQQRKAPPKEPLKRNGTLKGGGHQSQPRPRGRLDRRPPPVDGGGWTRMDERFSSRWNKGRTKEKETSWQLAGRRKQQEKTAAAGPMRRRRRRQANILLLVCRPRRWEVGWPDGGLSLPNPWLKRLLGPTPRSTSRRPPSVSKKMEEPSASPRFIRGRGGRGEQQRRRRQQKLLVFSFLHQTATAVAAVPSTSKLLSARRAGNREDTREGERE